MRKQKGEKTSNLVMEQEFGTSDILRIFDLKKERLRQWIKLNYIYPYDTIPRGPGNRFIFTRYGLYSIGLFKKLIDFGLNRFIASEFAWAFDFTEWMQIKNGGRKFMVLIGKVDRSKHWRNSMHISMSEDSPSGFDNKDVALVVNLYKLVKEIDAKL